MDDNNKNNNKINLLVTGTFVGVLIGVVLFYCCTKKDEDDIIFKCFLERRNDGNYQSFGSHMF